MFVATPLQTDVVLELVTVGVGFTVKVNVCAVPLQPFKVGVMEYVTVPLLLPVVVSMSDIEVPEALLAPDVPLELDDQEKVAPADVELIVTEFEFPEHKLVPPFVSVMFGAGLTVKVNVVGVPEQPFAVGVMV
jgi:hypothetical protein